MLLAQPPPEGAEAGIFGPDIFAGEVFEVQGFDDYDYSNFVDDYDDDYDDDYTSAFDIEENSLDGTQNPRESKRIKFVKTSPSTTTSTTTTTTNRPKLLKFRYRILDPSRRLPYRPVETSAYRRRYY